MRYPGYGTGSTSVHVPVKSLDTASIPFKDTGGADANAERGETHTERGPAPVPGIDRCPPSTQTTWYSTVAATYKVRLRPTFRRVGVQTGAHTDAHAVPSCTGQALVADMDGGSSARTPVFSHGIHHRHHKTKLGAHGDHW